MNSLHPHTSTRHPFLPFIHHRRHNHHHHSRCLLVLKPYYLIACSSVRRHLRPSRRKRFHNHYHHHLYGNTSPLLSKSSEFTAHDQNHRLKLTIDLENLTNIGKSKVSPLVSRFEDAYLDLQTLITRDEERRLVVSCKRSTVEFVGGLVVLSYLVVFSVRVLVKLVSGLALGLGFGRRNGSNVVIVRRDRSLGGKEVVVGKMGEVGGFKGLENPLSVGPGRVVRVEERIGARRRKLEKRGEEKLPEWWPEKVVEVAVVELEEGDDNREFFQREANRLVRAMVDKRLHGKDIMEADIIQLRRICRTSRIRVSFGTINTRDSFYRVAVNFVLNFCSSAPGQLASVPIDVHGEDPRQFIAGLAENIGLESIRAARIVSAAVAARTRSCLLQAWALEMQGDHPGALKELSKICLIHRIFPPTESSPEMEMVALGLEKQLKADQREFLMNMLVGVCGEESPQSLAEALGLALSSSSAWDQQEKSHA